MAILGSILKKAIELRGKVPPSRKTVLKKQLTTLQQLMKKAEFTAFGEHYQFSKKLKEKNFHNTFRNEIPAHDYNSMFKNWWYRCLNGEPFVCWPNHVKYFALSSGTSESSSKHIPVTRDMLKAIRKVSVRQTLSLSQVDLPKEFFQKRVLKPEPIEKDLHITIKQSYEGAVVQVEIDRVIRHENTQTVETELLIVNIPQGINDEDTIVLQNKGHVVASVSGDVKLNIHVKNDTEFRRNGLDLYFTKTITLKEALCGFKFKIDHLNGNQMTLNVNVVIFTGAKQVIKNLGMIKDGEVGNFILEFVVSFPESLTPEQKTRISEIL